MIELFFYGELWVKHMLWRFESALIGEVEPGDRCFSKFLLILGNPILVVLIPNLVVLVLVLKRSIFLVD